MAVAGGLSYIPVGQYRLEKTIRQYIDDLPGNLTVEKISVDMLGDSIELEKLSGTLELFTGMPFDFRVRKLRFEGLNRDIGTEAGAGKIADLVFAEHFSFSADPAFSKMMGYSSATVNSQTVRGVWLDWNLLQKARNAPHPKAFADMLLSLRLGPLSIKDASVKVLERGLPGALPWGDYIIAVSRLDMEHYSLNGTGRTKAWNYSQVYANGARVSLREMGFASRRSPSGAIRLKLAGLLARQGLDTNVPLSLLEEGYALRELDCRDLIVVNADGESLHIPSLQGDVDIGRGNLLLYVDVPDMWISGSLAADALSGLDRRLGFLADRKLHFSALVDWKVEPVKDDSLSFFCHQEFHETKLGSLVFNANFLGATAAGGNHILPFELGGLAFESGRLELEDGSFLREFFAFGSDASQPGASSADKAKADRKALAEEIKNRQAATPAFLRGILGRFAVFLEKSGFLSITAEARPPLPVADALNNPQELEKLSVKAVYSE